MLRRWDDELRPPPFPGVLVRGNGVALLVVAAGGSSSMPAMECCAATLRPRCAPLLLVKALEYDVLLVT